MKRLKNERLIFDNAVLSNFARIQRLDLLLKLPCELITTKEVIMEIQNGIKSYSVKNIEKSRKFTDIIEFIKNKKIKVVSITTRESLLVYAKLEKIGLGHGEISTMVLAKELKAIFITDERRATNIAKKIGINVIDKYEFRATAVILKLLSNQKIITAEDLKKIKKDLKKESFQF